MTSPGKSRWLAAAMVGGTLIGGPGLALAAPFDGATPLLCAVQTVMECERSGQCVRVTTDEVDLPALLRVDVPKKMISAANGAIRTAEIRSAANLDGQLVLQGGQHGRGWSVVIMEASGRMSAAVVDSDAAFTVFGACAVLSP
jgi:hypothetical protein